MAEMKSIPGGFKLMPPAADKCQVCAGDHPAHYPHNRDSLYFQYSFYADRGRWPVWVDAMEHCSDKIRDAWIEQLKNLGVGVDSIFYCPGCEICQFEGDGSCFLR